MIRLWLGDVTEALHNSKDQRVAIKGKIREIRALSSGLRSMEIGKFTFITQNPSKDTLWGKFAREGKKVTQVKYENKWYGVIVNHEVLKYQPGGKDPTIIGNLVTDCASDNDLIQPSPEILAAIPKDTPGWIKKAVNPPPPDNERIVTPKDSEKDPDFTTKEGITDFVKTLLHGIRTGQLKDAKRETVKDFLVDAIGFYVNDSPK